MSDETAQGEPSTSLRVPIERNPDGTFVKGHTGNPGGRPPASYKQGRKNLRTLKQNLEIAVRESLSPDRICRIVTAIAEKAEKGDVKAAKLILDKVISNASDGAVDEDDAPQQQRVVFNITNATFAAIQKTATPTPVEGEVIEVEAIPVTTPPPKETTE